MKNKILLVDDHPLVREWLANLINEEADFEVCGQAGNAREAIDLIGKLSPRMAVVDISLDGGSGLELIKDIKAQHPKVNTIVLSMHDETLYAERAMRAGASGYIMKREATGKVLDALRAVLAGGLFFSNAVNAQLAQKLVQGSGDKSTVVEALSDRELEVFQLLGRGFNTRQISEQMNVSFKTVQAYCARIKEKLNLANINELIFHAVRWHESQSSQ
ncbi:MAG TPA: response regulator transcription factor [Verrucomicrobiae bacterium]